MTRWLVLTVAAMPVAFVLGVLAGRCFAVDDAPVEWRGRRI